MPEATTPEKRGRRGDGTVYETKDGRHRGSIFVPDLATGRPTRRFVSAKTAAEVQAKIDALRSERTPKTPTLSSYVERWLAIVRTRVRPPTERTYRLTLGKHVLPSLGEREMGRILPSDVESLTAGMMNRGSAAATAALAHRVLSMVIGDAEHHGLVTRNVARLSRPPRIPAGPPRALTPAEVRVDQASPIKGPDPRRWVRPRHRREPLRFARPRPPPRSRHHGCPATLGRR